MDKKPKQQQQSTGDTKTSTEKSAEKEKKPVDSHFVDSQTHALYNSSKLYY